MNGRQVYKFATENVPGSIRTALRKADLQTSDVDYFVLHQANSRIVERIARDLGVSIAKFPINIQEYGNTAAASEPILLDELVKKKNYPARQYHCFIWLRRWLNNWNGCIEVLD